MTRNEITTLLHNEKFPVRNYIFREYWHTRPCFPDSKSYSMSQELCTWFALCCFFLLWFGTWQSDWRDPERYGWKNNHMNLSTTTSKPHKNTTKPCAYLLGCISCQDRVPRFLFMDQQGLNQRGKTLLFIWRLLSLTTILLSHRRNTHQTYFLAVIVLIKDH